MIIKTWRDPYDAGFSPTKPKEIEIQPGFTVLVGCNGAGKSTLLLNIQEHCKENNIPCLYYDNLHDGGSNAMSSLFYFGDYVGGADLFTSSEGESIKINIGRKSTTFNEFIQNGYVNDREYRLIQVFSGLDNNTVDVIECKDRVFLFDAVDSGLSVDSVVEIKDLFELVIDDNKDLDRNIYIVIAANEYELARNVNCFDVNAGKYIKFLDYEDYRSFIIKSRVLKEKRIEKQAEWREKQKSKELKEYTKVKAVQDKRLAEYNENYKDKEPPKYDWHLREIEDMTKDFFRKARFVRKEDVEDTGGEVNGKNER